MIYCCKITSFLVEGENKMGFLSKLADGNKRVVKSLAKLADQVIGFEDEIAKLTDDQLREKTVQYQKELAEIEDYKKQEKYLDKILPEAYAIESFYII